MNEFDTNQPVSVIEALNRVQSWLNAGEYEKVIQGCQEILQLEPGNSRALALLKQAEERKFQANPLEALQVEDPIEEPREEAPAVLFSKPEVEEEEETKNNAYPSKKHLLMAMLLPALLVVVIGGTVIGLLAKKSQTELVEDSNETAEVSLSEEAEYLQRNEERKENLDAIKKALEAYMEEEGFYPTAAQIDQALLNSGEFNDLPKDPMNGEVDKAGHTYGYVYAVYEDLGGNENGEYILSALFEDSRGFGHPWTGGRSTKNHPDYRELEEKNVTLIE